MKPSQWLCTTQLCWKGEGSPSHVIYLPRTQLWRNCALAYLLDVYQFGLIDLRNGDVVLGCDRKPSLGEETKKQSHILLLPF